MRGVKGRKHFTKSCDCMVEVMISNPGHKGDRHMLRLYTNFPTIRAFGFARKSKFCNIFSGVAYILHTAAVSYCLYIP